MHGRHPSTIGYLALARYLLHQLAGGKQPREESESMTYAESIGLEIERLERMAYDAPCWREAFDETLAVLRSMRLLHNRIRMGE